MRPVKIEQVALSLSTEVEVDVANSDCILDITADYSPFLTISDARNPAVADRTAVYGIYIYQHNCGSTKGASIPATPSASFLRDEGVIDQAIDL